MWSSLLPMSMESEVDSHFGLKIEQAREQHALAVSLADIEQGSLGQRCFRNWGV